MRNLMSAALYLLKQECPNVFHDLNPSDIGNVEVWVTRGSDRCLMGLSQSL
jgi:hypothetical protein